MKKKKWPVYSERMNKWLLGVGSVVIVMGAFLILFCILGGVDLELSEPGHDISHTSPVFEPYIEFLFYGMVTASMIMAFLCVFNFVLVYEPKSKKEAESPLRGAAVKHEKEIVELLKTVAQPLPGKGKLNRARTAQFLRALIEMELIDVNLTGKHLMAWVEKETEYKDGDPGHFQRAIKDATPQDTNVAEFRKQIEQIVSE